MPSRRISKLGTLVNILGMKIVSLRNGVTMRSLQFGTMALAQCLPLIAFYFMSFNK
jgi:hypothetical protein